MVVISKEEFYSSKQKYLKLLKGSVFIYPTDSIYGIGCDARNHKLVEKVRNLKNSNLQAFSVIVPSKDWVYDNCAVREKDKKYIDILGEKITINNEKKCFTLILNLMKKDAVASNVIPGKETLGVRMPDHWISELVKELGFPIVTTSANVTGGDFMTSLDNLNENIKKHVDVIIYEGEKHGRPSTIIDLTNDVNITAR